MNNTHRPVRVRFAPSPTGHLHIGSLRVALFNYLFARHTQGTFLVRIEDTDLERSSPVYVDSLFQSLAWVGLTSDEPVVIQSERLQEHSALVERLLALGKVYRCYCTSEEVTARHYARYQEDQYIKYDMHCRFRTQDPVDASYVIRFALPLDREYVQFDDLVRGTVAVGLSQLDDFIIVRSDGMPVYNFVVVADDAAMNVSHVIRGEDHISNTPKQILLYEAAGYDVPVFAHLPLILGASGVRLSKRDAATAALDYCTNGYLPDALLNYLVRLGWAHGDQEIFTLEELIQFFSMEHVGKKSAIFDIQKLQWVNGVYLRAKSSHQLWDYAHHYLHDTPAVSLLRKHEYSEKIATMFDMYKGRVHTVVELCERVVQLLEGPVAYHQDDYHRWIVPATLDMVNVLVVRLQHVSSWSTDTLQKEIKGIAKELGITLSAIAQPVRIALQGISEGPGLFELLVVIGKEESMRRIKKLGSIPRVS